MARKSSRSSKDSGGKQKLSTVCKPGKSDGKLKCKCQMMSPLITQILLVYVI